MNKAEYFAILCNEMDFKPSNGWFDGWKTNLKFKQINMAYNQAHYQSGATQMLG